MTEHWSLYIPADWNCYLPSVLGNISFVNNIFIILLRFQPVIFLYKENSLEVFVGFLFCVVILLLICMFRAT